MMYLPLLLLLPPPLHKMVMGKPQAMPPTLLDQLVYLSLLMGKLDLAIDHEGLPMALYLPLS